MVKRRSAKVTLVERIADDGNGHLMCVDENIVCRFFQYSVGESHGRCLMVDTKSDSVVDVDDGIRNVHASDKCPFD